MKQMRFGMMIRAANQQTVPFAFALRLNANFCNLKRREAFAGVRAGSRDGGTFPPDTAQRPL